MLVFHNKVGEEKEGKERGEFSFPITQSLKEDIYFCKQTVPVSFKHTVGGCITTYAQPFDTDEDSIFIFWSAPKATMDAGASVLESVVEQASCSRSILAGSVYRRWYQIMREIHTRYGCVDCRVNICSASNQAIAIINLHTRPPCINWKWVRPDPPSL